LQNGWFVECGEVKSHYAEGFHYLDCYMMKFMVKKPEIFIKFIIKFSLDIDSIQKLNN